MGATLQNILEKLQNHEEPYTKFSQTFEKIIMKNQFGKEMIRIFRKKPETPVDADPYAYNPNVFFNELPDKEDTLCFDITCETQWFIHTTIEITPRKVLSEFVTENFGGRELKQVPKHVQTVSSEHVDIDKIVTYIVSTEERTIREDWDNKPTLLCENEYRCVDCQRIMRGPPR